MENTFKDFKNDFIARLKEAVKRYNERKNKA